ncbi:MAG: hypothetical protein PUP92_37640 [Rhizonema sp. PD38]|nr:hypothetical protein [Rhizonema sp. PD38]
MQNPEPDEFICQMPRLLGKGYERDIQVYPNILLTVHDLEYHDDVLVKFPESNHPLQFSVDILGVNADNTLISGAGIQRSWIEENPKFQRSVFVNIHMPPELLGTFFPTAGGEIPSEFSLLGKGNDWQTMIPGRGLSLAVAHCGGAVLAISPWGFRESGIFRHLHQPRHTSGC